MSSSSDPTDEIEEYVRENAELLARLLAHGDTEAQGYALALLANSENVEDIKRIEQKLNELKEESA